MSWLMVLIFLFGLCVGSFLNVLIYRLPRNLSPFGRSFCPKCKKNIFWQDNIPLLSFLLLRGRCRHCRSPISLQYPAVELITGILFVLMAFFLPEQNIKYQISSIKYFISLLFHWYIVGSLIIVFFTDLKYGIIPDKIIIPGILVSTVYSLQFTVVSSQWTVVNNSLSALGASAFLGFLFLVTKGRGMGLGDVKLAALMGLFLGFPKIIVAFYVAFLTGAAVSLILILLGKKRFGQTIPFGPFLAWGTLVALFLGEIILKLFNYLAF